MLFDVRHLSWRSTLAQQQRNSCRVIGTARQGVRNDLSELVDRCVGEKCEHLRPALGCGTRIGFTVTLEEPV